MKQSKHLLATIVMLLCSLAANAYDFEVDGIYYNITDKSTQKVEVTYKSVTRSYSGSVEIPNSVVYGGDTYDVIAIGNMAFQQCTDLTSIVIPESVTSIAALAFNQCKKLESIIIPGNVNFIGRYAFQDCNNLTQMTCFSKTPPTCFDNTFANFQVSGCTLYVPAFSVSVYQSAEYWNEFTNIQPLPSNDIASGTCGTNLTWTLYTDGELIIEGTGAMNNYSSTDEVPWYGYETSIKIVTIKEGVTSIGNYAFEDCSSLTTITVPEGVTSIGENAFFGCSNLTSIDIPKGVESIGEYAFCACNLIRITISTSVTSIGEAAFANNPNLAEIMVEQGNAHYDSRNNCNAIIETANGLLVAGCAATLIPEGVTAIGYGAFAGTKGLSSIFIPKNVNTIRANAFEYCDNLTEVNCAENSQLTSIGGYAFFGCISLTAISIPESVSSIGLGAFLGCSSLTAITSKATTPPTIGGSNTFNGVDKSIPVYVPAESVEAYKVAAFWKEFTNIIGMREVLASGTCGANLTWTLYVDGELVIEGNGDMTYSQNKAPWDKYTSSIEIVTIKKGVTSIGNWAFLYCGSLTSITIPESVTSIGISAFYECSSLTSITIPESVTSIGSSAFYGCNSLTSISIPKSVISIGNAAFCHCISLTSINIPASVTSIGNYAFDGCYSLTFITIPEGMTSIGEYVFRSCRSLTSITIPESVTEIGASAFNGCSSLTSITIPESVTSIGDYAFDGTPWYKSLPDGVVYVNNVLYKYKGTMPENTSIEVREGTVSISPYAFRNYSNLSSITSHAVTPPTIYIGAFEGVSKSIPVYVPASSVEAYKSSEDWSIFTNIRPIIPSSICGDNLTWKLTEEGELIIEGTGAMYNYFTGEERAPWYEYRESIKSITMKEGITSIGDGAFLECSNVTYINIPEGVTSIGGSAFSYCSSLTSITIPKGVTSIGSDTFYDCSSLVSITIPESVASIGNAAFRGCSSLTAITIPEGVTSIVDNTFALCSNLTSVTLPEGVTSIGNHTFAGCISLTAINIPESVFSIGYGAFSGCSSLTSIIIPDGVTFIRGYAFDGCSGLTDITIPASVTNIDVRTFSGCSSLTAITSKATTPPTIGGSNTFDGVDKSIPVYVPAESVEAYKEAEYWMEFDNILPIKESVESNITLVDGVDFEQESAEEYTGITYTRNFRNTNWQALYVPFEIPLTDEFLADFEVAYIYDVRQYDRDDDGVKDEIFIEAFKKKGGVLEANYPYLIRAKEAGEKTITVNDAILYATEENSYDCSSMFDTYTFTGTYHRMPANELTGCYALSGGVWQPVADDASLGAFRFYLKIETRSGEPVVNKARSIRMRIIDEDGNEEDGATRIDDVGLSVDNIETIIYDLQGRRITYTDNLKGVYIVNGKKVVF